MNKLKTEAKETINSVVREWLYSTSLNRNDLKEVLVSICGDLAIEESRLTTVAPYSPNNVVYGVCQYCNKIHPPTVPCPNTTASR